MSPIDRSSRRWRRGLALLSILVPGICGAGAAQVPAPSQGRLLFTLGGQEAGHETYRVERLDGGYRLSAEVELRVGAMTIAQSLWVKSDERLAFITAEVHATVNDQATDVWLERAEGSGRQTIVQGSDTTVQVLDTPASSVLLTNNVIHHIAQFAWLHSGGRGVTDSFTAFPRVPVTATLEDEGTVAHGGETLSWRRYYLNLANRLGAYVWVSGDGELLKVTVPLQAFVAQSEEHAEWTDLLPVKGEGEGARRDSTGSGYESEAVRFESGDISLAGTLTLPRGAGPHPAAVLISGSGPQDRDENTPGPGGLKMGIFRSLADTLTGRGIAVLRYDDRGVGESEGDFKAAGLSDLVADVRAAVRYLRQSPHIDGRRIALIGHSEGGIIAPIVGAEDAGLGAVVIMAGTATPLDSVLADQLVAATRQAGGDSAAIADTRREVERMIRVVREGWEPQEDDLSPTTRALAEQRKWLLEHFEHDPLATIREVDAPVLIVNGGQDVQVPPWHAERLGAALAEAGRSDFEMRIFARLNHLFAVSRGEGTAEYADPSARVDPEFLRYLADWLSGALN